jgi:hypothetical protein
LPVDAANLPFRVPDSWTPAQRIEYLEGLVQLGIDDGQVCRTAALIAEAFADRTGKDREIRIADAILRYVQTQVPYVADPNDEEWYQGPVYTLAYGGDCEDLSVLVAALSRCAGLQADVHWIDQPNARLNHVVSRIEIDGVELFADASITTAFLGEHPHDAVNRSQQFDRLGLSPSRSSTMTFPMPTDTRTRSAGQGDPPPRATPPARPEHGYDPSSADYAREMRLKSLNAMRVAGITFAVGVLAGATYRALR